MFWANKKVFIFRQGNCMMNALHPSVDLLWAFAAMILWKTQPKDIFARVGTAKCIASCNHDASLEDNYCVPFFKLKSLITKLHHIFCSPKLPKIYGESDFKISILRNKLGKYTFLWFKKRDLMGGKYKWILPKNMLSSSLVDIIFLHTFLL